MKKQISVISAVILALVLFSCKGAVGPAGPSGESPEAGWYSKTFQQGTNGYAGCYDVRIWDALPTTNYGSATESFIGSEAGEKKRFIIEFYPTGVPAGAVIQKATLSLQASSLFGSVPTFAFYEITDPWVEAQTTWNVYSTGNSWTTPGGDFTTTADSNSVAVSQIDTWYTWTLNKDLIQQKIGGGGTYGFIMVSTDETGDREAEIKTSEYAVVTERPILTIYYSLP